MWSEKFLWPQSQGFFLTTIPGIFFVTTIPGTDFVTTIPGMIMNKSLVRIQLQSVLQRDIASYDPFLRISWLWSNAQTLISPHYIRAAIFFHSKVPFPFPYLGHISKELSLPSNLSAIASGLENIHTQAAKRYQYCQNLAQIIYNFCVGAHWFLSRYTSCNVLKIILLHLGAKSICASFDFDPAVNDPHF